MNLLDKYKTRLKQLLSGESEIYEGETDTIKEVIESMEETK